MDNVKWYMRLLLVLHTKHTKIEKYTKQGRGLIVTTSYKLCCNEAFLYSIEQEFYELKGKHNRRARRHK